MRSATASFDSFCTCVRLHCEASELVVAGVLAIIDGGIDWWLGAFCSTKGVGAIMGVETPIVEAVPIWGDWMTALVLRFRTSCSSRSM